MGVRACGGGERGGVAFVGGQGRGGRGGLPGAPRVRGGGGDATAKVGRHKRGG